MHYYASGIFHQHQVLPHNGRIFNQYLPDLVPFLSALFLNQRSHRPALIGVALAFAGLVFLSFEGSLAELSLSKGDSWGAAGGIGWALYFVPLARYSVTLNIMLYSSLHTAVAVALSVPAG